MNGRVVVWWDLIDMSDMYDIGWWNGEVMSQEVKCMGQDDNDVRDV